MNKKTYKEITKIRKKLNKIIDDFDRNVKLLYSYIDFDDQKSLWFSDSTIQFLKDGVEYSTNVVEYYLDYEKTLVEGELEKYNYLTDSESKMSRDEINLQIALGLKSCDTIADVKVLLNDARRHELSLQKLKK